MDMMKTDTQKMDIRSAVSRHRQALMGIAILVIMYCHNSLWFVNKTIHYTNFYARIVGASGVDLFMFCSGYAMYASYIRSSSVMEFYGKRLRRVLPAYLIMMAVWCAVAVHYGSSASGFLHYYSVFSFFTKGYSVVWFIPAVLTMYLLYPLFHRMTGSGRAVAVFCTVVSVLSFWVTVCWADRISAGANTTNMLLVVRLPVFVTGAWWGRVCAEGRQEAYLHRVPRWLPPVVAVICVVGGVHSPMYIRSFQWWWVDRFLFWPLTVSVLLMLVPRMDRLQGGWFYRLLCFCGSMTLEMYLIHEHLLNVLEQNTMAGFEGQWVVFFVNFTAVAATFPLSWLLHKACTALQKLWK